jgi:dolichol-phosphate mannosyltransferase
MMVGLLLIVGAQIVGLVVLCARLSRGRTRLPVVEPGVGSGLEGSVSVVVPARNEASRIGPCLAGLRQQGSAMLEAIIVDGGSTDGTTALVDAASLVDARIGRIAEPGRPSGAVGRPWAIDAGCTAAHGEWILVIDADTAPRPGMVAGAAIAAKQYGYDAVSFAPRIDAPSVGARWLQPSFLATLVYRFGPVGADVRDPERAMANGQCLLLRRSVLEAAGGYRVASNSFCDDIRIVRHLAQRGARVGFLDGRRLFDITMYETAAETWRAWPRSLNMRDATSVRWRWLDGLLLLLTLALPVPVLSALLVPAWSEALARSAGSGLVTALAGANIVLLLIRVLLLGAMRPSFAKAGLAYWLSPIADPAAALRVIATTIQRPREWRGRLRAATAGGP